jgi:DNA-binding FadR family transcriptional regulator
MLAMRRAVVLEVIRMTATRVPRGATQGARLAMARAWQLRDQPSYVREDFEVMRQMVEAAKFTPGLWLLNRVSEIWVEAASSVKFPVRPPDDYVSVHTKFFDLIENGKGDEAVELMSAYLERHDSGIIKLLQVIA